MLKLPSLALLVTLLCCHAACKRITDTKKEDAINYSDNYYVYLHAESLFNKNNDSSFYYFNKVATSAKDSQLVRGAYTYMGMIQHNEGDYFGSQESYLQSLNLLNEKKESDHKNIVSNYNGLGEDSWSLKNYDDAINYFESALKFSKIDSDKVTLLNNIGTLYKDKKDYTEAIRIYDSIVKNKKNSPINHARIVSNLAYTKWLKDKDYPATQELLSALEICRTENDRLGLNASYGHLTDYFADLQPEKALEYAQKMYENAKVLDSPDDQLWALQKLTSLSAEKESKNYFKHYQELADSLQTNRNKAKNQFALIRYETEKHKADKLILQKENAETRLRVIWQQVISVVLVIAAIIIFIWYRKRKQQAIREQQLRLSQKVHDKVANRVYRIMSEVEHKGIPEKSVLLYKLDAVYQQSRDLSYDQPGQHNQDFQHSVTELLESFASDTIKIASVGNSRDIWNQVAPNVKEELSIIIEELMTNMKKHSSARNVVVKFMQKENGVEMQYADDGIGLLPETRHGNGLRNTETRIKDIGGHITFDKTMPGLKVRIFIPIAK